MQVQLVNGPVTLVLIQRGKHAKSHDVYLDVDRVCVQVDTWEDFSEEYAHMMLGIQRMLSSAL